MPSATGAVQIYLDRDYQGASATLEEGSYDIQHLKAGDVGNDAISSLRVAGGYQVTVYKDAGLTGASAAFTADTPWVGADFDDAISSLKITKQGEAAPTTRRADAGYTPTSVSLGTMDLTATVSMQHDLSR
ncbi:peptidase inhibitor family I36 protein [Streptomyces goshikiensis]|uniref:peptidase inhibitor family I36 protein n=1 Tax=Streptomyces goshikiensis TaxID=1942 RepID=UPI003693D8BE